MNNHKSIIFLFSLFLFISGTLLSKNYYLDATNGNDSNNGTSITSAWKSLTKLNSSWSLFNPGDSILFKRGEVWRPSGSSTALIAPPISGLNGTDLSRIVFGAYGVGVKPIISVKNSPAVQAVYARNISYVTFQDIEFRGDLQFYGSLSTPTPIHHIRLLRITVDGAASGDATGGCIDFYAPAVEGAAEVWNQSEMHDIELGYSIVKNTTTGSGIQIYGTGNNWIHNNQIFNSSQSGINFAEGDNNVVEYNLISGTSGPGIKHSVHSHTAKNLVIRGNLILNSAQGGICAYNLVNAKIYNNTIRVFGNETAILGWTAQSPVPICGVGTTGFQNNYIMNNIFYGGTILLWKAGDVKITYKDGTVVSHYKQNDIWVENFFKNNIIYNPSSSNQMNFDSFDAGTTVYYSASTPGTYARTLVTSSSYVTSSTFSSTWLTKANVSQDLSTNPLFVNDSWTSAQNFGDFRLQANSPAAGTGVYVPNYNVDINGNPIPQSSNPDRGAIQSSFSDATQPTLISAVLSSLNSLTLTFSEKVKTTEAQTINNYSITNGVSITSATLSSDQTQVTLTTSNHSYDLSYSVTVNNLHDLAGNIINPSAKSKQYSIASPADVTPPTLVNATLSNLSTLVLTFSEKVVTTEAQSIGKYSITNGITIISASISADQTQVTLTTSNHSYDLSYTVTVANIHDLAGNLISSNAQSKQYSIPTPADVTPPTLLSANLSDLSTLILKFSEKIRNADAITIGNYSISSTTNSVSNLFKTGKGDFETGTESWIAFGNNSISTSTDYAHLGSKSLKITYSDNPGGAYLYLSSVADLASNLVIGKTYVVSFWAKINSGEAYLAISGGNLSPVPYIDIPTSFQKCVIQFTALSENQHIIRCSSLTSGQVVYIDDLQIAEVGVTPSVSTINVSINSAVLSTDQTQVTLTTSAHTYDLGYTVSVNNVHDLAGNNISASAQSKQYSLTTPVDGTAPTLTNAALSDQSTLVISFSEKVKTAEAQAISNYSISNGITVISVSVSADQTQATLTTSNHTYNLSYNITVNNVHDLAGNLINTNENSKQYIITSPTSNNSVIVSAKVFLQGPYENNSMKNLMNSRHFLPLAQPFKNSPWNFSDASTVANIPTNVVDWVLIGLRTSPDASTIIAKKAAFLATDGTLINLDGTANVSFSNVPLGNYYLTIEHRNHLSVMSSNPISFTSAPIQYDFTTSQTQAYGLNPMADLGDSRFGMCSGDGNADGNITASDNNAVWLVQFLNSKDGYNSGDYNLDGAVTASDNNMQWLKNNGSSTQVSK